MYEQDERRRSSLLRITKTEQGVFACQTDGAQGTVYGLNISLEDGSCVTFADISARAEDLALLCLRLCKETVTYASLRDIIEDYVEELA